MHFLKPVTAQTVIAQLKSLPAAEKRKVVAYLARERRQREDASDLRAVQTWKKRGGKTTSLDQVKREIGLS
jgi:predicted nucleotidyltransferase